MKTTYLFRYVLYFYIPLNKWINYKLRYTKYFGTRSESKILKNILSDRALKQFFCSSYRINTSELPVYIGHRWDTWYMWWCHKGWKIIFLPVKRIKAECAVLKRELVPACWSLLKPRSVLTERLPVVYLFRCFWSNCGKEDLWQPPSNIQQPLSSGDHEPARLLRFHWDAPMDALWQGGEVAMTTRWVRDGRGRQTDRETDRVLKSRSTLTV